MKHEAEWRRTRQNGHPANNAGRKKGRHAGRNPGAYRRPAKKLHPDLNRGNKVAEEKFKEVSAANDLLSDPEQARAL
jgi:hypothetical protein